MMTTLGSVRLTLLLLNVRHVTSRQLLQRSYSVTALLCRQEDATQLTTCHAKVQHNQQRAMQSYQRTTLPGHTRAPHTRKPFTRHHVATGTYPTHIITLTATYTCTGNECLRKQQRSELNIMYLYTTRRPVCSLL